jgi:predicted regulator of Ras-like GTPase activity (Roadblock/LC7/MglB family)
MAFDPTPIRNGMQRELARLFMKVPSAKVAAIASEDGLLAATHDQAEPTPVDRRGAVLASLIALARSASRELGLEDTRWLVLGCKLGVMLVRPFGRKRRRLLLLVLGDSEQLGTALNAAKEAAVRIDAKYGAPAEAAAPASASQ